MKLNKTFTAITTLMGTVIGAGIIGIPYVVSKSGFPLGLIHIVLIGLVVLITSLYLGEIGLRTKKDHQLPGYAEIYLGKKGKFLMVIALAFGIYASLLAYLIGESQSLSFIIFNNLENTLYPGIIFWIILSALSYFGLRALEEGEKIGISAIILLIISITLIVWNKVSIDNISYISPENAFIPFGVILFAYLGFAATPEIERILKNDKNKIKKVIIISYILMILIYTLFTLVVLGFKGRLIQEVSTLALGKIYIILGMVTMVTSYLGLSIALINTFRFDYKISKNKSIIYVSLIPLILFLFLEFFPISSFTKILGIGGAVSGGISAILILLMIKRAKITGSRKPEYSIPHSSFLTWILITLFSTGVIIEIFNIIT